MVRGRHLSVLGKVLWEKCSFKKFFSGLLPYRYRNIIPIVAPYNCWKEFPYICSEGARVQVLQRCTSSGIIISTYIFHFEPRLDPCKLFMWVTWPLKLLNHSTSLRNRKGAGCLPWTITYRLKVGNFGSVLLKEITH